MKITAEKFKELLQATSSVAESSSKIRESLRYIKIECKNDELIATATNSYVLMQYKTTLDEVCNDTFYILPFKIDKKYVGEIELLKDENNNTIAKYDNQVLTFKDIQYPLTDSLISNGKNDYAKIKLSKKDLLTVLKSCNDYIEIYLSDNTTRPVYFKEKNKTGLIIPLLSSNWN